MSSNVRDSPVDTVFASRPGCGSRPKKTSTEPSSFTASPGVCDETDYFSFPRMNVWSSPSYIVTDQYCDTGTPDGTRNR